MRLIDADALIAYIQENSESYFADYFVQEWVDNQPTVDAVPVVRCKGCEFLEISGCYGECGKALLGLVSPNDYCSRGERKEQEE